MQEEARVVDGSGSTPEKMETGPRNVHPVRRAGGRHAEPLLVELAWLIIDTAKAFQRLRRILARI
jgi:hypothetical protein